MVVKATILFKGSSGSIPSLGGMSLVRSVPGKTCERPCARPEWMVPNVEIKDMTCSCNDSAVRESLVSSCLGNFVVQHSMQVNRTVLD